MAIAQGLRYRGIDITTPGDARLLSADDEEHLSFGRSEGRVILTHDDDFLRLASTGVPHAGIAYCHQQARTIGEIVRYLDLRADCLSQDEMAGRVEFI